MRKLIEDSRGEVVEEDGRGVFNVKKQLKKNKFLHEYIKNNHSSLYLNKFREENIENLIKEEASLSIKIRKKYAFQIYSIGKKSIIN